MLPAVPIARRPSLVEETCAALAEHIFGRRHEGGEVWLPSERDLAQRFGVSRPVIREATKRLELQGILEIHHGKGLKVAHDFHKPFTRALELQVPDPLERLQQLAATRRTLEPESARLAALRATAVEKASLRSVFQKLVEAKDLAEAARADAEFHLEIARMSGNQIVVLLLQSFAELGEQSRMRTLGRFGAEVAIGHHEAILRAIETGDAAAAEKTMLLHVEKASQDLKA